MIFKRTDFPTGGGGRPRRVALASVLLSIVMLVSFVATSSAASSGAVSFTAPARVQVGALITLRGRVAAGAGYSLTVQRRVGRLWRVLAQGYSGSHGRYVLTATAPLTPGAVRVRVVVSSTGVAADVSAQRVVRVRALPKGAHLVVASTRTEVLDPSVVTSVPAPGQSGPLRYAGGNNVRLGQIIAIGVGPATPYGFLGRVTKVATKHGATIASTRPATLLEAVPHGSLHATLDSANAARAHTATSLGFPAAPFSCSDGVKASVASKLSFDAGVNLNVDWGLFSGVTSASLTAHASADASLKASLSGSASCKLPDTELVKFPGPTAVVVVGIVPVVLTSEISVSVDGDASVSASTSTGLDTGFSAEAGVGWDKDHGFHPIGSFKAHFNYTRPAITASASVGANLTPTLDIDVYGVAGPEIKLKGGLTFDANTADNPWWKLTAPIGLTAGLAMPDLGLKSPTLDVWKHTFPIADAGGPFGPPPPAVTVTAPANQIGSVNTPTSLQIGASDNDHGELRYTASGLPAGLSIDARSGLISGTPSTVGSSSVTVTVDDVNGASRPVSFIWTIRPDNFTWTGAAPAGQPNWSNGTNWEGGFAPSGTVGTLTFPGLVGSCTGLTCLVSSNDVNGLRANAISFGGDYSLNGSGVTVGAGGISAGVEGYASVGLGLPVTLGAAQKWVVAGESEITLLADVSGNSALGLETTGESNLDVNGHDIEAGPVTVNGWVDLSSYWGDSPSPSGSLDASDGQPVEIAGGYLAGTGSTGSLTATGGAIQPAGGPIKVNGDVALESGSTLREWAYAEPSLSGIVASGNVDLSGAQLSMSACAANVGETFTFISASGTISGTFAGVADGTTVPLEDCYAFRPHWALIHYNAHAVTATVLAGEEPSLTSVFNGLTEDVFGPGTFGALFEDSTSGGSWLGATEVPYSGALGSAPAAVVNGGSEDVFWRGTNGPLYEESFSGGSWLGATQVPASGSLGSAPTAVVTGESEDVFWKGTNGPLYEESFSGGSWHGAKQVPASGTLGSAPTAVYNGQSEDVFWKGTNGPLYEESFSGGSWHGAKQVPASGTLGSAPTAVYNGQSEDVFWKGTNGPLYEESFSGGSWHGAKQVPASGTLGSAPTAVYNGQSEDVFWKGTNGPLYGESFSGGSWHGATEVPNSSSIE